MGSSTPEADKSRAWMVLSLLLQPHPTPCPRFARHFMENGTNHRHLFKVFGIRFDILVNGKASVGGQDGGMVAETHPCCEWQEAGSTGPFCCSKHRWGTVMLRCPDFPGAVPDHPKSNPRVLWISSWYPLESPGQTVHSACCPRPGPAPSDY